MVLFHLIYSGCVAKISQQSELNDCTSQEPIQLFGVMVDTIGVHSLVRVSTDKPNSAVVLCPRYLKMAYGEKTRKDVSMLDIFQGKTHTARKGQKTQSTYVQCTGRIQTGVLQVDGGKDDSTTLNRQKNLCRNLIQVQSF